MTGDSQPRRPGGSSRGSRHALHDRSAWPPLDEVPVRAEGSDPITGERERHIASLEARSRRWRDLAEKLLDDREVKP